MIVVHSKAEWNAKLDEAKAAGKAVSCTSLYVTRWHFSQRFSPLSAHSDRLASCRSSSTSLRHGVDHAV